MATKEIGEQINTTAHSIGTRASIIGGKTMRFITEKRAEIAQALPKTEQQRRAERQATIKKSTLVLAGAGALVGMGTKYGKEIMQRLPFGTSEAERIASVHQASGLTTRSETAAYPADLPETQEPADVQEGLFATTAPITSEYPDRPAPPTA